MLNKIILQGRLTREPEIKSTSSGKHFAQFTIASDRPKYGDKQETDFISCIAWEKTATFLGNYFHKGDMILITGRMTSRGYETQSGEKRTAYEVLTESIDFCGSKAQPQPQAQAQAQTPPLQSTQEEIPFEV